MEQIRGILENQERWQGGLFLCGRYLELAGQHRPLASSIRRILQQIGTGRYDRLFRRLRDRRTLGGYRSGPFANLQVSDRDFRSNPFAARRISFDPSRSQNAQRAVGRDASCFPQRSMRDPIIHEGPVLDSRHWNRPQLAIDPLPLRQNASRHILSKSGIHGHPHHNSAPSARWSRLQAASDDHPAEPMSRWPEVPKKRKTPDKSCLRFDSPKPSRESDRSGITTSAGHLRCQRDADDLIGTRQPPASSARVGHLQVTSRPCSGRRVVRIEEYAPAQPSGDQ